MPRRYARSDLSIFSADERHHLGIDDGADPANASLAWELLYRLEPDLYDRLASAEPLHPGIVRWLPSWSDRIVEIGAGAGRLTLDLLARCRELTAIEPAAPLRERLQAKLERHSGAIGRQASNDQRVRVIGGFLDALPVQDHSAELVIACSVLTADASHGGDRGLAEMERACAHGGMVVIVWPNGVEWLRSRGYRYLAFPGPMAMEFPSLAEAIELAAVFYPDAVEEIRRRGQRDVPYELLGVNPPNDLAYKRIA